MAASHIESTMDKPTAEPTAKPTAEQVMDHIRKNHSHAHDQLIKLAVLSAKSDKQRGNTAFDNRTEYCQMLY